MDSLALIVQRHSKALVCLNKQHLFFCSSIYIFILTPRSFLQLARSKMAQFLASTLPAKTLTSRILRWTTSALPSCATTVVPSNPPTLPVYTHQQLCSVLSMIALTIAPQFHALLSLLHVGFDGLCVNLSTAVASIH
jgi:hypothetical protein